MAGTTKQRLLSVKTPDEADDAITLDNSNMTIPEQKAWLMEQYQKAIAE